jgi:hypothetical protein
MSLGIFSLSPAQQAAGQQTYSYFYNYAINQGADQGTATEFANLGLGEATTEGLVPSKANNPWASNPDAGASSFGPFQLYNGGGLANQFGINSNSSPDAQLNAAATTMWGEPGTGGSYNTQPWYGGGRLTGAGNDSATTQQALINRGQTYADKYGFSTDGSGSPSGDASGIGGGGSSDFATGDSDNPPAGVYGIPGQAPTPPQDASGNLIGAQNPDNQTFNFPQDNGAATDFGGQPFDSGITGIPPGSSADSGMAAGLSPTALTGAAGGVFTGTPLASLGLGGVAPTGDANTPAIASGTGSGGGTSGGDSGGGIPVDITDPSKIAVDAGSKVQEGAKDLGKSISETGKAADTTITASTASLTSTGTGWLQYAGNLLFDFIPRAGFGLAAIVLILMGLWLMGKQNEGKKT